jgi:hypothetical protein
MTDEIKLEIILTYTSNPLIATLGIGGYYRWLKFLIWEEVEIVTSEKE